MKVALFRLLAAGAIGLTPAMATAQSDTLSTADRARVVQDLENSHQKFLAAVQGLSEAQWRFKPAPARWSIAEVAEHLTLVEQGIGGMVISGLQPIPAFAADSAAKLEAAVRALYGNRAQRMTSPEGFVPTGKWATETDLMTAYLEARKATLAHAMNTKDPLRGRGSPHPAFGGPIDGAHWLVVLAAHMNRHLEQIGEVKAAQGYPTR